MIITTIPANSYEPSSKWCRQKVFRKPLQTLDGLQERQGWLHACLRKTFCRHPLPTLNFVSGNSCDY